MNRAWTYTVYLLASLLLSGRVFAADAAPTGSEDSEVDWQKECDRVKDIQPPKEDMSAIQLKALRGCNAGSLYYSAQSNPKGAGNAEWDQVRACAITTSSSVVMMMLYANGYGVRTNYDLAIKYACGLTDSRADFAVDDLISDLAELKESGGKPDAAIDFNNYATSGLALKFSDAKEWDKKESARILRLDAISSNWSARHKNAFAKLREAVKAFAEASSRNETDQAGTGRVEFMNEAYADIEDDFVQNIEQSENGEFPNYTQAEFEALDEKLNQSYRAIMHPGADAKKQPEIFTGITRDGIKEAQRAWLKYRDAWVAFGRVRYPSVPGYAWKSMLTGRRIKQLDDLRGDF